MAKAYRGARIGCLAFAFYSAILLSTIGANAQIQEETVIFESEGARLVGSVVMPQQGAVAVAVLIHGSGPTKRMMPFARIMASHGIGIFTYDKRGVGESEGEYEGADNISSRNLALLASDAKSAFVAIRKRVANLPAGFLGVSQAGWIAPIAALQTPEAQFMGMWSGPACSVSEELFFSALAEKDANFWQTHTEAQVTELMKSVRYRADDIDPRYYLKSLSLPALWLYGSADNSIPVSLSVSRLDELISNGRTNFQYRVFAGMGHELVPDEQAESVGVMAAWIKKVVKERPPAAGRR